MPTSVPVYCLLLQTGPAPDQLLLIEYTFSRPNTCCTITASAAAADVAANSLPAAFAAAAAAAACQARVTGSAPTSRCAPLALWRWRGVWRVRRTLRTVVTMWSVTWRWLGPRCPCSASASACHPTQQTREGSPLCCAGGGGGVQHPDGCGRRDQAPGRPTVFSPYYFCIYQV